MSTVTRSRNSSAALRDGITDRFTGVGICESTTTSNRLLRSFAIFIDDDCKDMDALRILQRLGYRIFEAWDGDKARAFLARQHTLIVTLFTDVQMPGTRNGFVVARDTARRWPHIAIVDASGQAHPGPDDMLEGACFIGKPFTAGMAHDHLNEIMPVACKPDPLGNMA